jgi:hypothetical protein
MPMETPGVIDLLTKLTNFAGVTNKPTTDTDGKLMQMGMDPSSPNVVKQIAASLAAVQAGGSIPDEETTRKLGDAFNAHMKYTATESLLKKLTKAYSDKYTGAGTGAGVK